MPNVSNAELHKLITQFQQDFNAKCDAFSNDNKVLGEKIDNFGERLNQIDLRLNSIDADNVTNGQKLEQIEGRVEKVEKNIADNLGGILDRLAAVESDLRRHKAETTDEINELRSENERIKEELENRTNRQLRRTLIFKNIPETKEDESYADVKNLLSDIISSNSDISKVEAYAGIERAHREAKREGGRRTGKRKIFAAFLDWDLPQKILQVFRKKGIEDKSFKFYAEQMYGPMTSMRRNLAFKKRRALKDEGTIVSAFVAFPAKLLVNRPGEYNSEGKKLYREYKDFSREKVERNYSE